MEGGTVAWQLGSVFTQRTPDVRRSSFFPDICWAQAQDSMFPLFPPAFLPHSSVTKPLPQ